jgi:HlyD family secretion protein
MTTSRIAIAIALVSALFLGGCENGKEPAFQGWIEADLIFVGPDEAGRVETLAVREGDEVAVGMPLFALDADLQAADVHTAAAQVAEARARLARLESAQQRKEEVAVLEAQERRAESAVALSTSELDRVQTLYNRGGIASQAQLDVAKANAGRDRAALEEVRRQITVARMASREEDIAAARQSLVAAEARRSAAETKLARRRVAASIAGTVQQIYYRPGEMVAAGKPVLAVLPPGNLKVRFFVSEALLPKVKFGDVVNIRCDGCSDGITAKVSFISRSSEFTPPVIYSLDERNKLVFMIEARTEQPERLRIGQPVTVTFAPTAAAQGAAR